MGFCPLFAQDLEYLIEKTVDPKKADYAVIVGVQIHNWASELVPHGEVSLEFVAPSKAYTVVNGVKTFIALAQVPVSVQTHIWFRPILCRHRIPGACCVPQLQVPECGLSSRRVVAVSGMDRAMCKQS